MYMYNCMYIYMYMYMYTIMYMYMCMHMCMCMYIYEIYSLSASDAGEGGQPDYLRFRVQVNHIVEHQR